MRDRAILWDLQQWASPGCGDRCSRAFGHDAETHERYGMAVALTLSRPTRQEVVRTGPLEVWFRPRLILVDGEPVSLSPLELEVLLHLARCLGKACSSRELVTMCWDASTADVWAPPAPRSWAALRTRMSTLRLRLGTAGPLIETLLKYGYRLRDEPPG